MNLISLVLQSYDQRSGGLMLMKMEFESGLLLFLVLLCFQSPVVFVDGGSG